MRRLSPCAACHRHVAHSESSCPFCRALVGPALLAAALSFGGCDSSDKRSAPEVEPPRHEEPFRREAVADAGLARDAGRNARRSPAAVYGAPPVRNDAGKACKCPPDDPLCSCL